MDDRSQYLVGLGPFDPRSSSLPLNTSPQAPNMEQPEYTVTMTIPGPEPVNEIPEWLLPAPPPPVIVGPSRPPPPPAEPPPVIVRPWDPIPPQPVERPVEFIPPPDEYIIRPVDRAVPPDGPPPPQYTCRPIYDMEPPPPLRPIQDVQPPPVMPVQYIHTNQSSPGRHPTTRTTATVPTTSDGSN